MTATYSKQRETSDPMPVYCDGRGYGLLHPMEPAPKGKGIVQFGSSGPFDAILLDDMEPVSWKEFDTHKYSSL